MVKMRTGLTVNGHHCPTILQGLRMQRAHVNHRFESKNVALFDLRPLAWLSIIWNLRILMHPPADAMAHVIADNRISVRFRVRLNGKPYVAEMIARAALLNRQLQAFFS